MKNIHHFDAASGEFLKTSEARVDPIEGTPMVPAYATLTTPPEVPEGQVAIWDGKEWSLVVDKRGVDFWLADGTRHTVDVLGKYLPHDALTAPPPSPRSDQRKEALSLLNQSHSTYLVALTGGSTVAERDTWKVKEEAARAFVAGTATDGQMSMLSMEANGAGVTVAQLSSKIAEKADAFMILIGIASAIRAQGRAAILRATDEAVEIDKVAGAISAVFTKLEADVQEAIEKMSE